MNETEEEERCTKHKLPLSFICQTCKNLQCCYKCFSISNLHYQHQNSFIAEKDMFNSCSEIIEESQPYTSYDRQYQQSQQKKLNDTQQLNDHDQFNQMKNYKMQLDELCKQITEQVWNYRQKFIQYMDQKLNEYNEFIIFEQGSQITDEIISMRNELENFIINLKDQISNFNTQNEQKQGIQRQLRCCCQSTQKNIYYQNNQLLQENSNNDEEYLSFQNTSPSFNSCSFSNSSPQASSSQNSSPSLYSCSSSSPNQNCIGVYQQNNQKQNQLEYSYQMHDKTHYDNSQSIYQNNKSLQFISNKTTKQYQHNCPIHHKQGNQGGIIQQQSNLNEGESQLGNETFLSQQQSPYQSSQIFIILTNGKSLPLLFNIYSSVLQIKILIFEKTGVPPLEQKLFYQTKELHNYTVMKDYNIPRDCSIKLYIRSFYQQLQSICKKAICSKILSNTNFQSYQQTLSADILDRSSNLNMSKMVNENNQQDEAYQQDEFYSYSRFAISDNQRELYQNQQSDNFNNSKYIQNQNQKNNHRGIIFEDNLYNQNNFSYYNFISTRRQF